MAHYKNNHFVPRRHLRRFSNQTEKQISLYNLKSEKLIEGAPIKSQCSRSYFYTKDPKFEKTFTELEVVHQSLFERMIAEEFAPTRESEDHKTLSAAVMFQEGRTVTAVGSGATSLTRSSNR